MTFCTVLNSSIVLGRRCYVVTIRSQKNYLVSNSQAGKQLKWLTGDHVKAGMHNWEFALCFTPSRTNLGNNQPQARISNEAMHTWPHLE